MQDHDERAKQIIKDLMACLRDWSSRGWDAVIASAQQLEEDIIAKFAAASELKPQVESLTSEKAAMSEHMSGLKAALEAEVAKVHQLTSNNEALKRDLDETVAEKEALQAELDDLKQQFENLGLALEEEKQRAACLEQQLEEAQACEEQGESAHASEIGAMRADMEAKEAEAEAALLAAQEEIRRLETMINEKEGDLEVSQRLLSPICEHIPAPANAGPFLCDW